MLPSFCNRSCFVQGAVHVPVRISKVAGAKGRKQEGWAYVIDWMKNGAPDNDVSDVEVDDEGHVMRRNIHGELIEVSRSPV